MDFGLLEIIVIVLAIALVVSACFHYLKLPVILGYLAVGVIIGPDVLGWVTNQKAIYSLAEFGVVLLMFTVGLEFSFKRLTQLKFPVFVLGTLQVLACIYLAVLVGGLLKMNFSEAVVIGGIVAMSSTALVMKQLTDQMELRSQHGKCALGILLFQDLAVIPFFILVASLASPDKKPLISLVVDPIIHGYLAIALIWLAGRLLLRPAFHWIAATRITELFTLAALLVTLGSALLTHELGLTYALGAFVAGMMLGETEYRHQIEAEIRPFRDILLGLFFISIGLLIDFTGWGYIWEWILLMFTALVLGKFVLITLLCLVTRYSPGVSARTGIMLAHGGEFGFAILALAAARNLIPSEYSQVILAALFFSIVLAPLLIRYHQKLLHWLLPSTKMKLEHQYHQLSEAIDTLDNPIIICGFGRIGTNIGSLLRRYSQTYVALDIDPERIQSAMDSQQNVLFGDATHPDIIKAARISSAKAVVITFKNIEESVKVITYIRQIDTDIPVIARCSDEQEMEYLQKHGATRAIAEIYEESLSIGDVLLLLLGFDSKIVNKLINENREKDYEVFRKDDN